MLGVICRQYRAKVLFLGSQASLYSWLLGGKASQGDTLAFDADLSDPALLSLAPVDSFNTGCVVAIELSVRPYSGNSGTLVVPHHILLLDFFAPVLGEEAAATWELAAM